MFPLRNTCLGDEIFLYDIFLKNYHWDLEIYQDKYREAKFSFMKKENKNSFNVYIYRKEAGITKITYKRIDQSKIVNYLTKDLKKE